MVVKMVFVPTSWGGDGVTPVVAGEEGTESGEAWVVGCNNVLLMCNREPAADPVEMLEELIVETETPPLLLVRRVWWCRLR